jgi:signal transduction histidine kinase/CheY-like chemotaxis protein
MKADTKDEKIDYNLCGELYQKLFNSLEVGFALCELILDQQGNPINYRFLKINSAFEKQTALNISSAIGKTVTEIYPDIEHSWIEKYGAVVINNKPIHFIDFNHNTNRFYNVNAVPVSKNMFAMYFEDITEKKKSEVSLKKSKKQYKGLFNSMVEMFQEIELIYDKNNKVIDYYYLQVNPAFEKLVNKKKEELIGKRAKEIFEIVEDYWLETYDRVEKTGIPENYENYGKELNKYYNIKAWKIGEGKVAIIFTDITEKKKIKKTLKESESQHKKDVQILNEAQQMANIGSWEWNVLTNEIKWSDFMFILLGLNPNTVKPSYELALHYVHEDDKVLYEKKLEEALTNKTTYYFENKIKKEDNSVISVISRGKCFLDTKGNLIRMVGTVQDITAQKQIEKTLVKNQRLKAIGEMTSSIAHDFNNSLQSMNGNIQIAKRQDGLSSITLDRLNTISTIITDAASRVKALQSFGDTKHDNKESEFISFNLIIKETLKQSRPIWKDGIEKKGFKINLKTDFGDIPKINCNKGELKSAIFNLIKNSIEAMPEGGTMTIKTGIKTEGIFATFTDTGIGMDDETKLKIFQPFYTTKGFELGRGLGMSGVYSLIKKHGGDIRVKFSELGKGTTIEIVCPISKQNDIEEVIENKVIVNDNYNVLWVDDNLSIRETSSELLEVLGHNCDTANGGKNALQLLDKNNYDFVFTDIGMPEMTGWELIDAIRNRFGDKIKIVIVTGWDIDEHENKNSNINYNYSLQKPFTIEELEKAFKLI